MISDFLDRISAWATDHPHQATLLTILGIAVFILLNLVLNMWPMIILLTLAAAGILYMAIYGIFDGGAW